LAENQQLFVFLRIIKALARSLLFSLTNSNQKGIQIMASKTLFRTVVGKLLPKANAVNEAGGSAYSFSNKHALAQYAATGCLNSTFYASDDEQLAKVLELCEGVQPEFIARTALYARERGFMKDLPAFLCAVLSVKSPGLMAEIFDRVIDSPKMLRNFVQIMRSGVVGRKSLGTLPKRLILQWLEGRSDEQLFNGSVGNDPSLADIIKMVHPKPASASRAALFGYLIGGKIDQPERASVRLDSARTDSSRTGASAARLIDEAALPEIVQQFEKFKRAVNSGAEKLDPPDVPFQMLTALPLSQRQWKKIARDGSWQMTRMNLNTFARHGVFGDQELIAEIANRLRNEALIEKAKAFPYQLMVAYLNAGDDVPHAIRESLQDAMEIATRNVPRVAGKVFVFPDVSGSMQSPVTGHRKGSTSKVRCLDVAALVAAAVLRKNPNAEVIPFSDNAIDVRLNPRDSIMTNAQKLASLPSGGTNCSAPLRFLNDRKANGDLVIYVSDNESWIDSQRHGMFGGSATETMKQWASFQSRNPQARMVCIDIQPYGTTQAAERTDITNIGGFSDQVFSLIADMASGQASQDHWVTMIETMSL
jgi:60 kDa SS-A/Ro ribonucleoprotein